MWGKNPSITAGRGADVQVEVNVGFQAESTGVCSFKNTVLRVTAKIEVLRRHNRFEATARFQIVRFRQLMLCKRKPVELQTKIRLDSTRHSRVLTGFCSYEQTAIVVWIF